MAKRTVMAAEISTIKTQNGFQWIDVFNPRKSDIEEIAKQFDLHSTSVQDCLDPEHLPKFEKLRTYSFLIVRAYDEKCAQESDTVQELTRKIAIFYNEKFMITIHRKDQPFIAQLRSKWQSEISVNPDVSGNMLLADLIKRVFLTFEAPIDTRLDELELYEMGIFQAAGSRAFKIEDGYFLKRKAFVFKRVLRLSMDALQKVSGIGELVTTPYFQDLKETLDSLYFYADELVESTNSLLGLYISLQQQRTNEASHRTNEVMRVLTIFSVFFLPLNLLASIYGMNFTYMPELQTEYGYPMVLAFMAATAIAIYIWFRRKGLM